MKAKFNTYYDEMLNVLVERYNDRVSLEDVLFSWQKIVRECPLPEETKGLVFDCGNAHLDFTASEHKKIVDFYRKNIDFFGKYKIGMVANTPHNIVIFMLIAQADSRYYVRPFTSLNAALEWVKR